MLKIDFHVHSDKSPDAIHDFKTLSKVAKARGFDAIAICDHNYLETKREQFLDDFLIIYGTEVSTSEGHISVFGSNTAYERGIRAIDLSDHVRNENAVSIVTHPFAIRKSSLGRLAFKINATAIEKFNGSDFIHNLMALKYIRNGTGGSDAHTWYEIGNAHTLVDADLREDSILEALRKGKITPKYSCNYMSLLKRFFGVRVQKH